VIATLLSAVWWWPFATLLPQPRPNSSVGPGEVIQAVVRALENYNSPSPNAGIFTTYQFASPANRANTGPYGNFLRLVKNPAFAPLLMRHATEFGPLAVQGDHAEQELRLRTDDGRSARFHFVLSRQTSQQTQGRCGGCWMVDQVNVLHGGQE
jgi:Domain of unknown function (DUF4864)